MSVEDRRQATGEGPHLSESVLEIVVVVRPSIHVCAMTTRSAESPKVEGVRRDPRVGEPRRDMRIAARMLRDAVDEK